MHFYIRSSREKADATKALFPAGRKALQRILRTGTNIRLKIFH